MADIQGTLTLPAFPERFRLTTEFRLLLACSWFVPQSLEQAQAEKITSLCRECVDWNAFVSLVNRHRVPALVYANLCKHAGERLPGDIREKLKERSSQARKQALHCAVELVRLIKMFVEHGIGVIPLKGPLLSLRLFGDPGTRHARDIDLMIRPEDLDRIDKLLASEGYRCIFPGFELSAQQLSYLMTGIHHFEYVHGGHGLTLELHWRSFLWTPEQASGLWNNCLSVDWMGVRVNCPDDDALLLYLCDHGAGHKWFRIKWLSDVAMMLSQDRPDGWDNLLAMADRLDLRRTLAQTALLVHWLYEITLPGPLQRLIELEEVAVKLGITAISAMLASSEDHLTAGRRFGNMRRAWYFLRLKPSLPYGMVLKGILICPPDFKEFRLPNSLFWLYIPLRPVFWFWRNFMK